MANPGQKSLDDQLLEAITIAIRQLGPEAVQEVAWRAQNRLKEMLVPSVSEPDAPWKLGKVIPWNGDTKSLLPYAPTNSPHGWGTTFTSTGTNINPFALF